MIYKIVKTGVGRSSEFVKEAIELCKSNDNYRVILYVDVHSLRFYKELLKDIKLLYNWYHEFDNGSKLMLTSNMSRNIRGLRADALFIDTIDYMVLYNIEVALMALTGDILRFGVADVGKLSEEKKKMIEV